MNEDMPLQPIMVLSRHESRLRKKRVASVATKASKLKRQRLEALHHW